MKINYLIMLVLGGTFICGAQIPKDKALHFLGGNLYGLVGAGVANELSNGNRAWTFAGSVGGSLLVGLAKEAIDERQYNGWDNGDVVATVLGGLSVGVVIDVFKQKRKRKREKMFREVLKSATIDHVPSIEMFPPKEPTVPSLALMALSDSVVEQMRTKTD
ncbi:hypothetical protein [Maribacter sp. 2307ULW6-5]|uniref:hypothetical protein n=1 Tax=Maribacter sp. 2307ULW6-5 TaxID=3386275 RepID=UPI0039BC8CDD